MVTFDLSRPKASGAGPVVINECSFTTSGSTADVTTNRAYGCSVARTGVGLFTVTMDKAWHSVSVGMSVTAASTAQLFKLDSNNGTTLVIRQVTAGGNTAVDTLAARIDLVLVCR